MRTKPRATPKYMARCDHRPHGRRAPRDGPPRRRHAPGRSCNRFSAAQNFAAGTIGGVAGSTGYLHQSSSTVLLRPSVPAITAHQSSHAPRHLAHGYMHQSSHQVPYICIRAVYMHIYAAGYMHRSSHFPCPSRAHQHPSRRDRSGRPDRPGTGRPSGPAGATKPIWEPGPMRGRRPRRKAAAAGGDPAGRIPGAERERTRMPSDWGRRAFVRVVAES